MFCFHDNLPFISLTLQNSFLPWSHTNVLVSSLCYCKLFTLEMLNHDTEVRENCTCISNKNCSHIFWRFLDYYFCVCPYILWFKKSSSGTQLGPPQRGPNLNLLPWRYLILGNDASPALHGRSCACVSAGELHAQWHWLPSGLLEIWVAEHWWVLRTAAWAPVSVDGVAPEQRQPAVQRSVPEFVWTSEAYVNTSGLQRLG